jgi:hypothetical protein
MQGILGVEGQTALQTQYHAASVKQVFQCHIALHMGCRPGELQHQSSRLQVGGRLDQVGEGDAGDGVGGNLQRNSLSNTAIGSIQDKVSRDSVLPVLVAQQQAAAAATADLPVGAIGSSARLVRGGQRSLHCLRGACMQR